MATSKSKSPMPGSQPELVLRSPDHRFRDDTYMICCPARSGSTLLVHLLRSHPRILSHGEVMGADGITGLSGPLGPRCRAEPALLESLTAVRREHPELYLYSYILNPHGKDVVGFKLKYEELVTDAYRRVNDFLKADLDLKIIFLDRDNLFERYVSHYVALHVTGVTLVRSDQPKPEVRSITLDPEDIERSFKEELEKRRRFRTLFAQHRSIEVIYEELVADTVGQMNRVFAFLGLPEHAATTNTQKILDKQLANIVEDCAEIFAHFSGSEYARYFADVEAGN